MFLIFRENIYLPFLRLGVVCIIVSYLSFIVLNTVTPAYLLDSFFTNASAFVALKFLPTYLLFCALVILLVATALYAYIEIGRYSQQIAFLTEKRTMLEVRLPENSQEGLASMEAVLEMISYGSGEGLWFPVWWSGKKRPIYSLEIVSRGGAVSFIIHTRAVLTEAVRSAVFSFYPRAHVTEIDPVDDHVFDVAYDPETHGLFTFEWKFSRNDALPIKTYIEFQLEKRLDPGAQTPGTAVRPTTPLLDPLASLYDLMRSMRGDERFFVQYVFRTQKYAFPKQEVASDPTQRDYWKRQKLPQEIQEALVSLDKKIKDLRADGGSDITLTQSEKRLRETGARLMEKQALEVGIRMVYIASKENFSPSTRIAPMTAVYKLTNTSENSLIPYGTLLTDYYDIPALDPPRLDKDAEKDLLLQLYRDRLFWHAPALYSYCKDDTSRWSKKVKGPSARRISAVMTTETLATLCHLPTSFIPSPPGSVTLSTTVEPPQNLPV